VSEAGFDIFIVPAFIALGLNGCAVIFCFTRLLFFTCLSWVGFRRVLCDPAGQL